MFGDTHSKVVAYLNQGFFDIADSIARKINIGEGLGDRVEYELQLTHTLTSIGA